jgi:hypothetical protein
MSYLPGIAQKDSTKAEADRVFYQNLIEGNSQQETLISVKTNLELYEAFIIPLARNAEFLAATAADKCRFLLVAQRTFLRDSSGADYVTVFEEEYLKEFG